MDAPWCLLLWMQWSFFPTEVSIMLLLDRGLDESIFIGDDIKVTVVDIRGDKVRLGIEAPREIPVHRWEIQRTIVRDNMRLFGINPDDDDAVQRLQRILTDLGKPYLVSRITAGDMRVYEARVQS